MALLREFGCEDLRREGSILKQLLKRHSVEEIETAMRGLRVIFPKGPVSLKMVYGRSRIGSYVGFVSAYNAGITDSRGAGVGTRVHRRFRNGPVGGQSDSPPVGLEGIVEILKRQIHSPAR